ncbi:unnamed protein product, partial [Staurois parvus]
YEGTGEHSCSSLIFLLSSNSLPLSEVRDRQLLGNSGTARGPGVSRRPHEMPLVPFS